MEKRVEVESILNELDVRQVALKPESVGLFKSLIDAGVTLPPIGLYIREGKTFVYDGRTRLEAHRQLGKTHIQGVFVDYTTRSEMILLALRSNLTTKGAPVAPTLADFSKVVRDLSKEGTDPTEITRQFIKIGIPEVFAKKIVKDAMHSKRKLDELHAVESIRAKRMNILEASTHYNVPVKVLHAKLAADGYDLDRFGLDLQKKFKGLREFAGFRLPEFVNGGTTKRGKEAVLMIRKRIKDFESWLSATEVSLQ